MYEMLIQTFYAFYCSLKGMNSVHLIPLISSTHLHKDIRYRSDQLKRLYSSTITIVNHFNLFFSYTDIYIHKKKVYTCISNSSSHLFPSS